VSSYISRAILHSGKYSTHATYDKQQGQAPNPINVDPHTFTHILHQKHNLPIKIAHVMYMTGTTFQAIELLRQLGISYKVIFTYQAACY